MSASYIRTLKWALAAGLLLETLSFLNCGGGSVQTAPVLGSVLIAPQTVVINTQSTKQFSASFTGPPLNLIWSVNNVPWGNSTVGTIDASGLYTAPLVPPTPNTVSVTATGTIDPQEAASASVTIVNPSPAAQSASLSAINAGSSDTVLTVSGSGFTPQSVLKLANTQLGTTYVNAMQLTAVVPATLLATAGDYPLQVVTPPPGGGTTTVTNLVVQLVVAVSPSTPTVFVGQTQPFAATITGSSNQVVSWSVNGIPGGNASLGTIDATGLYAPPVTPPSPNTLTVTATSTADPTRSASASVTILNPVPSISSVSPAVVDADSGDTVLTVTGAAFTPQSSVKLGSTPLVATYGSATQLTAVVTAAQLTTPGTLPVQVVTPPPGGGASNPANLAVQLVVAVTPPAPTVSVGQTQAFAATVTGSSNHAVTWLVNGIAGGNASLGTISAAGLYTAPTIPPFPNTVTVTATSTADPTRSASASVTIPNLAPLLSSISPTVLAAGSTDTVLTVTGLNFVSQTTVTANATSLYITSLTSTQLVAIVPSGLLQQSAVLNISVVTPGPGGGQSLALSLTVVSPGQVSNTNNPQVAQYSLNSPRDATLSVEFGPDTNYGLHTWSQPTPTGGGQVNILVAGMRANTTYHMRATVNFPDGTQYIDSDHSFTTGGLPPALVPQITVSNPNGLTPSPGIEMFHLTPGTSNQVDSAAFDVQGNLIWYYDPGFVDYLAQPIKLLPNGHLLVNLVNRMREIDLAGNTIRELSPYDVTQWLANAGYNLTVYTLHHDVLVLPNGHWVLLVSTIKTFTDLPGYPGQTNVTGDALVDLDQNLQPVWVWSTFDHLDVNRHPMYFPDWTHANAIIYSPDDGNLILSMRHQSWVIKIDYRDGNGAGDILWRLGYQGDFTISSGSPADWFYAEHYPIIVSPNSTGVFKLLVMDNGNNRVLDNNGTVCGVLGQPGPNVPGYIPCYSRAPIYEVDETAKTATVLWQYNEQPIFSFWGGSAQQLDNGNLVIDFNTPSDDPTGARYLEVSSDPTPQIVQQMEVSGQNAYRIIHMPSLYPGVQW